MKIKIIYIVDQFNCVIPISDWNEETELEENWHIGDIESPAYEEHGIPLWKHENDQCIRRTAEEVQVDIDAIPLPEPTEIEQLRADMDFLTMENESLQTDVEQAKADIDYLLMLTEE